MALKNENASLEDLYNKHVMLGMKIEKTHRKNKNYYCSKKRRMHMI